MAEVESNKKVAQAIRERLLKDATETINQLNHLQRRFDLIERAGEGSDHHHHHHESDEL